MSEKFIRESIFTEIPESEIDMQGELALMEPGSSLIVAYIEYPFTSSLSNVVVTDSLVFKRHAVRWPRYISQITFCDAQGVCSDEE